MPPGASRAAASLAKAVSTSRRLWWRVLGQGSGKNVQSSATDPGATRCSTAHTASTEQNRTFAALAAARLSPGGTWRLATDWADYADQMHAVLDAEPALTGGFTERWAERPVTKFERKGLEAGRTIVDLIYTRG